MKDQHGIERDPEWVRGVREAIRVADANTKQSILVVTDLIDLLDDQGNDEAAWGAAAIRENLFDGKDIHMWTFTE